MNDIYKNFYIKFRHDTYENCKNSDAIFAEDEIFIIDIKAIKDRNTIET